MPYIVMRHGIEHILNRPTLLPHYVDGYLLGAAAVLAEPLDLERGRGRGWGERGGNGEREREREEDRA